MKELSLTPAGMLVAQGEVIGEARGEVRGIKKRELEIIVNMLNYCTDKQIALFTKKSIKEIQKIREEYSK